jgi:periplasmic glucans biosynthesis protein
MKGESMRQFLIHAAQGRGKPNESFLEGIQRIGFRRRFLSLLVSFSLTLFAAHCFAQSKGIVFGFEDVAAIAKHLSEQSFEPPDERTPEVLQDIGYDQWRDIRFRPENALWRSEDSAFEVQFFFPGFLYHSPVKIHVVDASGVREAAFSPEMFTFGKSDFKAEIPQDLGFAGFRLHYPLNRSNYKDEVIVFLGASYFRAVAKGQHYGLSARGLAIDTATDKGEEFPSFKEFWLVRPESNSTQILIYALLDSPSVSGAYAFTVAPGKETIVDVESRLFCRGKVEKLGIAPLTSMFFYGENTNIRPINDFRPEIHDSDGLLVAQASEEWIWHPLVNPGSLLVHSLEANSVKGFGLLQRDLVFDHYQDLEAHYDKRPSVWITPREDWGKGRIELVKIPTPNEYNDNIIAYWVPENLPEPGQPLDFAYRMSWRSPQGSPHGGGYVVATRTGAGKDDETTKFVIDFEGEKFAALSEDAYPNAVITTSEGINLVEHQLHKNTITGGWRLVFQIHSPKEGTLEKILPEKRPPIHVSAFLRMGQDILTETWSYSFQPSEIQGR